jgi:hypothetical protein
MPETRDPKVEALVRQLVAQAPPPPEFPSEPQRASRHRRALVRRGAGLVGAVAIVVVVALIASALLSTSHAAKRQILVTGNPTTTTTAHANPAGQLQPEVVFRRNVGADGGASVVGDAQSGVWFLLAGDAHVHLDHLDAARSLRAIPMPEQFETGLSERNPMIAVDADGTAWALGQHALAEVSPTATTPRLFPLGAWPNTEIHTPMAIASDGAGHVAIAFQDTTLVRVFSAASGTFSDLQLPVGTDAYSLAYFGDGSLAMGLLIGSLREVNTALIAAPDGSFSKLVPVGDAWIVHRYSDTTVLFGSEQTLTLLHRDGSTRQVVLPAAVGPSPITGAVQLGRDGKLVVTTQSGVVILKSVSNPVPTGAALTFPRIACGPISYPGPLGPTSPGAPAPTFNPVCRAEPSYVRVGEDGTIWLFYSNGQNFVIKRIDHY